MTQHLSADELVSALDGVLATAPVAHLRECEGCRSALGDLEAVLQQVKTSGEVPEPSPLFWGHLGARIGAATTQAPAVASASWWQTAGGAFGVLGAVAALILVVFMARMFPGSEDPQGDIARVPTSTSVDLDNSVKNEEASWNAVAELASTLSSDDVRLIVGSAPDAPALSELTAKERGAFVRMLGVELGGLP